MTVAFVLVHLLPKSPALREAFCHLLSDPKAQDAQLCAKGVRASDLQSRDTEGREEPGE